MALSVCPRYGIFPFSDKQIIIARIDAVRTARPTIILVHLFIVIVMLIFPVGSVLIQSNGGDNLLLLAGKWFVFWAVGVRMSIAGLRQTLQPGYTAEKIFEIENPDAGKIVSELGFSNIAIGIAGIVTIANTAWIAPVAIAGAAFFGIAGIRHLFDKHRNLIQNVAMISDIYAFLVLALYLGLSFSR